MHSGVGEKRERKTCGWLTAVPWCSMVALSGRHKEGGEVGGSIVARRGQLAFSEWEDPFVPGQYRGRCRGRPRPRLLLSHTSTSPLLLLNFRRWDAFLPAPPSGRPSPIIASAMTERPRPPYRFSPRKNSAIFRIAIRHFARCCSHFPLWWSSVALAEGISDSVSGRRPG